MRDAGTVRQQPTQLRLALEEDPIGMVALLQLRQIADELDRIAEPLLGMHEDLDRPVRIAAVPRCG